MTAPNTGLRAQFGGALETAWGTAVTVTRFNEFLSEGIQKKITTVFSKGIRAGRRHEHRAAQTIWTVEGPTVVELNAENLGFFLKCMVDGTPATSGSNPYTHVFTPDILGFATVQVGRPDTGGTVRPFTYAGMYAASWELSVRASDGFAILTVNWMGKDEVTSTALATASYSTVTPLLFSSATFSIGGSEVCVEDLAFSGDNAIEAVHKICSTSVGAPTVREHDRRKYTGKATADFESLTIYDLYRNGTEGTIQVVFNAGSSAQLTLAGNARVMGETPVVAGPDVLRIPISFEFVSGTSDAAAFTATLINTDTTA